MGKKAWANNKIVAFFVCILVVTALIAYWAPESAKPSESALVRDVIKCKSDKISQDLLQTKAAGKLTLILGMTTKPGQKTVADFASKGITLFPNSWTFDSLVAETDWTKLCDLAKNKVITNLDIVQ